MGMLLRRHYIQVNSNSDDNTATGATEKVAPKPNPAKPKAEKTEKKGYTEEKINSMNGTQLRKLAVSNGIESPEELTTKELKAVLRDLLVG